MGGGATGGLQAVLFDVDFTLCKPGPLLGPEGYRAAGRKRGIDLDPALYDAARLAALQDLRHHPELDHDEAIWLHFTEDIVRGMGGHGPAVHDVAVEITLGWERHDNFELYDDTIPILDAVRSAGLKIALVSNTTRDLDEFVDHYALDVDAVVTSRVHGKVKPHPTIFRAALSLLGVAAEEAVMVGDSVLDDIEGARRAGIRPILIDRDAGHRDGPDVLETLWELPALLGIPQAA
ncbi:MAG: HAD family hydrolase [Gaiellales bacterium]